ncbi:class II aldolase/adducin family protein [Bythopirellula polymerisocia]|uniref:Short chain dehydrogenase n=1 Tax=Bythopirellula polymerisocia TaxID=2528003 RepID=A0A5C6CT05_9BACT|nr:class II aldolase/adducin family protein [Bythopirellula polymerisocia]TWU27710.1 short chain dehydrogenase [Bythopirellula polymerisocia]
MSEVLDQLLELSHRIGLADRMAILGEGNVSGRLSDEQFLIKASGTELGTLTAKQLVEVNSAPILDGLTAGDTGDEEIEKLLLASRVNLDALKPSVETLFHAWLLKLPDVSFIGHTHPICVNQILCSPRAKEFAENRLFPDQIVYCGAESVLVPYVDPGIILAAKIAEMVTAFIDRRNTFPKTILLENHGLIALGKTSKQVEAALLMAEKSAQVFVGATTAGGPNFLPQKQVDRIASRSDEHYRQRMIESA